MTGFLWIMEAHPCSVLVFAARVGSHDFRMTEAVKNA
jgi:hypothetical protein